MTLSNPGFYFIKAAEGLRLKAYKDIGGKSTIGYGHLNKEGLKEITQEKAEELLRKDVLECERCIGKYVKPKLNQFQFDALCDFIFNLGCNHFKSSTLLKLLNDKNYMGAADQFLRWIYTDGTPVEALAERRQAEKDLFVNGVYPVEIYRRKHA